MGKILAILAVLCVTSCDISRSIEGVVEDVHFVSGGFGSSSKTIVSFKDGRVMTFDGIADHVVFWKNKTNVITLARAGNIISITIPPQKKN